MKQASDRHNNLVISVSCAFVFCVVNCVVSGEETAFVGWNGHVFWEV